MSRSNATANASSSASFPGRTFSALVGDALSWVDPDESVVDVAGFERVPEATDHRTVRSVCGDRVTRRQHSEEARVVVGATDGVRFVDLQLGGRETDARRQFGVELDEATGFELDPEDRTDTRREEGRRIGRRAADERRADARSATRVLETAAPALKLGYAERSPIKVERFRLRLRILFGRMLAFAARNCFDARLHCARERRELRKLSRYHGRAIGAAPEQCGGARESEKEREFVHLRSVPVAAKGQYGGHPPYRLHPQRDIVAACPRQYPMHCARRS